jgi:hypothetical protein
MPNVPSRSFKRVEPSAQLSMLWLEKAVQMMLRVRQLGAPDDGGFALMIDELQRVCRAREELCSLRANTPISRLGLASNDLSTLHPGAALDPDRYVLEFRVRLTSGDQKVGKMRPVHADEVDRTVLAVLR